MEKMQLKRDTTTYYVSVCTLPESADNGNLAHAFFSTDRIEQIMKWFDGNTSPLNMP
jgi:hypothetical protein